MATDRQDVADTFIGMARKDEVEAGKEALNKFVDRWKGNYLKLGMWSEKTERMPTFYELLMELRALVYTNHRIESFKTQTIRTLEKQIQFAREEVLEKRIVPMAIHYNGGVGRRNGNAGGRSQDITSRNRRN